MGYRSFGPRGLGALHEPSISSSLSLRSKAKVGEGRAEGSPPRFMVPMRVHALENLPLHEPAVRSGCRPAPRKEPALIPTTPPASSAGQDVRLYGRRDARRYRSTFPRRTQRRILARTRPRRTATLLCPEIRSGRDTESHAKLASHGHGSL